MNIPEEKLVLRHRLSVLRRKIGSQEKFDAEQSIAASFLGLPETQKSTVVCIYMSLPEEVDTKNIISQLWRQNKVVVVPKIVGDVIELYEIRSFEQVERGRHGILEPKNTDIEISKKAVEMFAVPGIAFDPHGYRIGWGKGYYDKLLADIAVPKIGLAYDFQVIAEVPHTSYDVPVNVIVTDKEVIRR